MTYTTFPISAPSVGFRVNWRVVMILVIVIAAVVVYINMERKKKRRQLEEGSDTARLNG